MEKYVDLIKYARVLVLGGQTKSMGRGYDKTYYPIKI